MKNTKNFIIGTLLIVILAMAIGYSTFASQLTLNGTAEIVDEWDVKITGVEPQYVSENCDSGNPQFTNSTVTFDAKLSKPGDYVTYLITITNAGTIDATLDKIAFTPEESGSPAIIYKTSEPETLLPAGHQTSFLVMVRYDEDYTEVPEIKTKSITGIIEYVQQ